MKIGIGYDVHKFCSGRPLIIGGVKLEHKYGLDGHSDADVLTHAICDALLGASKLGDIGKLFPDTDDKFKDANSLELLKKVVAVVTDKGYGIEDIDSIIVAQTPKMAKYIDSMRERLANTMNINIDSVGVKATTTEGLGFEGNKEGIAAHATCILEIL